MSTSPPGRELATLHALYLRLTQENSPRERLALAHQILVHPASQRRLRTACAVVLKGWSRRTDLCGDVQQEALLRFGQALVGGRLVYEDRGPDAFGGWLWSMWHATCLDAWRHCRPLWLQGIELFEHDWELTVVDDTSEATPESDEPTLEQLMPILDAPGEVELRSVLLDWLGGLSVRESASRQGISKSALLRLRQRVVTIFQAARRTAGESKYEE